MAKTTQVPNLVKETSPSKNVQQANDRGWNAQRGYRNGSGAIADQHNKRPVPVSGKD
jgi:hypothetical protein